MCLSCTTSVKITVAGNGGYVRSENYSNRIVTSILASEKRIITFHSVYVSPVDLLHARI